uniref:hypothetical protein n=1 Tax=uncultured Croceitalea sp. TaxID=1798908 RepID=UPI0033061719
PKGVSPPAQKEKLLGNERLFLCEKVFGYETGRDEKFILSGAEGSLSARTKGKASWKREAFFMRKGVRL